MAHRGASRRGAGEHAGRASRGPWPSAPTRSSSTCACTADGAPRRPSTTRRCPTAGLVHAHRRRRPAARACRSSTPRSTPARASCVNVEIKNDPKEPGLRRRPTRWRDDGGRPRRRPRRRRPDRRSRRSASPAIDRLPGRSAGHRDRLPRQGHHEPRPTDGDAGRARPPWRCIRGTASSTRRMVGRCHADGLAVRPWTVRRPGPHARAWPPAASTRICTNVPDVAPRSSCSAGRARREACRGRGGTRGGGSRRGSRRRPGTGTAGLAVDRRARLRSVALVDGAVGRDRPPPRSAPAERPEQRPGLAASGR